MAAFSELFTLSDRDITHLVNITDSINNKSGIQREEGNERSNGVNRDHKHDTDNHPGDGRSAVDNIIVTFLTFEARVSCNS